MQILDLIVKSTKQVYHYQLLCCQYIHNAYRHIFILVIQFYTLLSYSVCIFHFNSTTLMCLCKTNINPIYYFRTTCTQTTSGNQIIVVLWRAFTFRLLMVG